MSDFGSVTAALRRYPLGASIAVVVAFRLSLIAFAIVLHDLDGAIFLTSGDVFRTIALTGYPAGETAAELTQYAYYPLFPITLKILSFLPIDIAVSTIALGIGITVFTLLLLYRLLQPILGHGVALFTLLAWGFAPPGWIYLAAFSEGLFVLIQVSLLHAMNKERFWLAVTLSGLLGASRVQGVFWALATCAWILRSTQSYARKISGILVALSGAAIWQGVIMWVTGSLLGYRDIVAAHEASNGFGIQPLLTAAEGINSLLSGSLDLAVSAAFALFGVLALIILLLRVRGKIIGRIPSIATALSGVFISADPGTQMTRYVTSSPVLFTGLAAVISKRHALAVFVICLLAGASIVHTVFSHGHWQMIP